VTSRRTRTTLAGSDFTTVGDIFSSATNPDRKKPFDIRTLMRRSPTRTTNRSSAGPAWPTPRPRWSGRDASAAFRCCCSGSSRKTVPGVGFRRPTGRTSTRPARSSRASSQEGARAINAASGNRPLVVLANLSGFDGSPESMRALQLEYGAEIGRAVVNFEGPIVFVVVSRYHGGAFVVFSKALNPRMTVLAVEGSFASVIGGAPAAAVVFATRDGRGRGSKRTIERALRVGSVDRIIRAEDLRPYVVDALERGMAKVEGGSV
jgi:hypothetical protein